MSGSYKAEWTEPSYGCCYMTSADYEEFKVATGSPERIYTIRHNILKKYSNQKPFNGDGKLFYYDWNEYLKSVPLVRKVNGAMQAEKVGRYNIMFNAVNSGYDYKRSLLGSFPYLSETFKDYPDFLYEDKISLIKNPLEGVKKNTGNIMKSVSLIATPEVVDIANKVTSTIKDANLKTESIIKSTITSSINSVSSSFTQSFTKLKDNITTITNVVNTFSEQLPIIRSQITDTIAQSIRDGVRVANIVRQQFTTFITNAEQAARASLTEAIADLSFAGLATLIQTPVDAVSSALVDQANQENSGGGGGGCVVATQLNNSGLWSNRQKAELVVWCEKRLHGKVWGECFRRGYQVVGSKIAVPNLRKNNLFSKYLKWSFNNGTKMVRGKRFSIISIPNTIFWISAFMLVGSIVSKEKAEKTYKKLYK